MIVKFQSDKNEYCVIDDVEKITHFRFSEDENLIVTVNNGEFVHNDGHHVSFDRVFISTDLINNHYNNKPEHHVPHCLIHKNNGFLMSIAFVEGYIMNNDGKTIDRI